LLLSCARLVWNWTLLNNSEDAARLEMWAKELEARGARPERLAWRPPDDGDRAVDGQASGRANLIGRDLSRMDGNLSHDGAGSLHVGTDVVDGSCNVAYSDDDLRFE
jgi:hypothetical protein